MAAVLTKLLEGEISFETFIERLLSSRRRRVNDIKNDSKDTEINITEFVPFFLNYLREHTSHHLLWRQNVPTPKKSRSNSRKQDISHNTSANFTEKETPNKSSSRGLSFTSQRTPSPNVSNSSSHNRRDRHHGKGQSPLSSPSMRRKSPRVTPSNQSINQTPSPLAVQPRPNLDDLEDFPTIGSISTPKSKSTPRRITPTPVKNKHDKSSLSFPSGTVVSPPFSGDGSLSPTSLQDERNMLKAIKSKRRSKGDSPWGNKASPNSNTAYRPSAYSVLGDFMPCTNGNLQKTKLGQHVNEEDFWEKTKTSSQSKQKSKNMELKFENPNNCIDLSEQHLDTVLSNEKKIVQSNEIKSKTAKEESSCSLRTIANVPERLDVPNNVTTCVELGKVTSQEKVEMLGKLLATLIQESLVPNVTSEVYFIAQLLTTRAPAVVQETSNKHSDLPTSDNILYSIHNTVYFAIVILENLKSLICLLDKGTLRHLALNPRIAEFSPTFKEWLDQKYKEHSTPKVLDISFSSPIGGVPFSADRDNKNNFPSDRAFQNFRKQRDVFYELVREWEDCHNKPGWTMEENMGNRIRSLVHQRPELANHSPFARLFQSQLLQMCKGENVGSDPNSALARLRNANPDKFQRLQDRFVTPLSLAGPCPPPSFTEIQEFFKGFIICAESHSFSRHLMDNLIVKITELNDTDFPLGEAKDEESSEKNPQAKEIQRSFSTCLSSLRILAKFLGYLVFEPYHIVTNQPKEAAQTAIQMRNKVPQPFSVLHYLKTALTKGHLVLTVPWVIEYLSMMDPVAPYLDYYNKVLIMLVHIYSYFSQVSKQHVSHSHLLMVTCLGWLFENPVIPESLFFKSLEEQNIEDTLQTCSSVCLDLYDIVNQEMLYTWCPYLGEVKAVLSEASTGMSSRAGQVKKITPVCTDQPTQLSSNKRQLLQQLEENFYRIQPDFFKRTSEFLIERLCSNILSGIKTSIVPDALKKGAEQMEAYLTSIGFVDDDNSDQAKERSRPKVLQLIHSVTSDAVKKALEITANSSETSLKAFQILCPEDTNPKVISTAAKLTARHVKLKSTDWIHLSLASMVEKDLFNHFDKFTNALLHAKAKEARLREAVIQVDKLVNMCATDGMTKDTRETDTLPTTPENILLKHVQSLKVLLVSQTRQLSLASSTDDSEDIISVLTSVVDDLTPNKPTVEDKHICSNIGNITVELAFILGKWIGLTREFHVELHHEPIGLPVELHCEYGKLFKYFGRCSYGKSFLSSEHTITGTLLKIWKSLKDNGCPAPLHQVLSSPRLRLLSSLENPENTWTLLASLCATIIHSGLVTSHNVEQWFLTLLDSTNDQVVVKACCELLHSYTRQGTNQHTSTGVEFSLLIARLSQMFSQDSDVLTSIQHYIKQTGLLITLSNN